MPKRLKACDESALAEKKKAQGEDAELDDDDREAAYKKARDRKAKDKKAKDKKAKDSAAKDAADKAAKDAKACDDREAALDAREAAMDAEIDDEGAKDRKAARDKRAADRKARGFDALPDNTDHRKDFRSNAEDAVTKDELDAQIKAERERSRDAAIAREKVRPLVGVVSLALDSAPDIYRFALKHANVKTEGVHDSALGALIDVVTESRKRPTATVIAQDSAAGKFTDIGALFGPQSA